MHKEQQPSKRLPDINWAALASFFAGIAVTWAFMYGSIPVLQGPAARLLGGVDLSWLAGGLVAAASYALLGPRVYRRYGRPAQPLTSAAADTALAGVPFTPATRARQEGAPS